MVEFAITSMLFLTIVFGTMDFAYLFASKVAVTNAVRAAARYAAANSSAWNNTANPPANTIEGKLKVAAVPATIINDDSHITISYSVPGLSGGTTCGQYSASSGAFTPAAGYTQATCVSSGNVVSVTAIYSYSFLTPMLSSTFGSSLSLTTQAREIIEN